MLVVKFKGLSTLRKSEIQIRFLFSCSSFPFLRSGPLWPYLDGQLATDRLQVISPFYTDVLKRINISMNVDYERRLLFDYTHNIVENRIFCALSLILQPQQSTECPQGYVKHNDLWQRLLEGEMEWLNISMHCTDKPTILIVLPLELITPHCHFLTLCLILRIVPIFRDDEDDSAMIHRYTMRCCRLLFKYMA